MRRTVCILAALCFILPATFAPARACFTHPGEPDALVIPTSPNTAEVAFFGFRTIVIGPTDQCALALKDLPSILSINGAQATIQGFPGNFTFASSAGCSTDFTTLFGSAASAFSATTTGAIPSGVPAVVSFFVTLEAGSTFTSLESELTSGLALISDIPLTVEGPTGGSPVAGTQGGGGGVALASEFDRAAAVCVPGAAAQIFATNQVTQGSGVPTLGEWGMIAAALLLLGLGVWKIAHRNRGSLAA